MTSATTRQYLGEFPVEIRKHPDFKDYTDSDWVMYFITSWGQSCGEDHKAWVIDQVARILNGTPVIVTEARWDDGLKEIRVVTGEPTMEYFKWKESMLGGVYTDGPFMGCREFSYNEGIAP